MKKILWASRHVLDSRARQALEATYEDGDPQTDSIEFPEITCQEILWPSDFTACLGIAHRLLSLWDVLAGVWPAQAVEVFILAGDRWDYIVPVISPVNEPVIEPDTGKVREFRFIRWAQIWPIG